MLRVIQFILLLASLLRVTCLCAQTCTTLGQIPGTAFPVCGLDTFSQRVVPVCGGNIIPGPCNGVDGVTLSDLNPFWYKFTCFETGTLGFTLTPYFLGDDYDWQLFDITGHDAEDVFSDASLFVSCNWSGSTGVTGASAAGTMSNVCATTPQHPNQPLFSSMPVIQAGHEYLLLVSHFLGSNQSGYDLNFGGGTAVITDTTLPAFESARAQCDGSIIYVKLNKEMRCSSLQTDGSDFFILPGNASIKSAAGIGCSNGFNMDSIIITLDNPLPAGNYVLVAKKGSDNSTLLDNCDRDIPAGDSIPFIVYPLQPTPLDSLSPVGCAPDVLSLVFKKNIRCNTIDKTDFVVTGTSAVTVIGAAGASCVNGVSDIINVQLSKPIETTGNFRLQLVKGNDGNTIIDECGQETPENGTIDFTTKDTVNADFSLQLIKACTYDTVKCSHPGGNGVDQWRWTFDINGSSDKQNTMFLFSDYGLKTIRLDVSNGVCTDSASVVVNLDNELKAIFTAPVELCPEDAAAFTNSSIGNIVSWRWDFGDGTFSSVKDPAPKNYPPAPTREGKIYPVSLIVQNDLNCFDTLTQNLKLLYTCYIAVPSAFTPNGDGLNDYLYPLNAYKADNLEFRVYNRWGQLMFETKDWTRKWNGTVNGILQGTGTYVWMLSFIHRDTGKRYSLKGTTVLIR